MNSNPLKLYLHDPRCWRSHYVGDYASGRLTLESRPGDAPEAVSGYASTHPASQTTIAVFSLKKHVVGQLLIPDWSHSCRLWFRSREIDLLDRSVNLKVLKLLWVRRFTLTTAEHKTSQWYVTRPDFLGDGQFLDRFDLLAFAQSLQSDAQIEV